MVGVIWVHPHGVVVHMLAFFTGLFERFTSVFGVVQPGVHREYFVHIIWIWNQLDVVIAAGEIV